MPFAKKNPPPFISAVVVAAGSASRMDGLDKQLMPLDGIPVVARSIGAMEDCPRISEIIVVCRGDQIADYYDLVRFYDFLKVVSVVSGGDLRQDSVFAGIDSCSQDADFFAVHDGARPMILPEETERCIDAAIATGAAAVGVPVKDTIKICGEDLTIVSTPRRERLWAIQTPQIFEAGLYRRAMSEAIRCGKSYTDDCQLIENAGYKVVISPGSHHNIKITTPEDVAIANAILAMRQG